MSSNLSLPVVGWLLLCSCAANAAPRAVLDTQAQHFGQVPQGKVVSQTFRLRNDGDSVLRIEKARFSMPGMSIRTQQEILPGTATDITIQWDTRGFSKEVKGQTLLMLNDPATPQMILTSIGDVQAPVEILPRPALYLSQYRGEASDGSLEILNHRNLPLQITRLEPRGSHFHANLETLDAGQHYRLRVKVPADTPIGRYRERLLLHTNDPARSSMGVEINILVKDEVYASPETVEFGQLSLSQLQQQTGVMELLRHTLVVSNRHGAMRITGLTTDVPGLQLTQDPPVSTNARTFQLEVGLVPQQLKTGKLSGDIELTTNNPHIPRLRIPVSGTVVP